MDFLENIIVANIYGVISERDAPIGESMKTHIEYVTTPTKTDRHELWYARREVISTFNGKKLHIKPGFVTFLPKGLVREYYVDRLATSASFVDIYFDTCCEMPEEAFTFDVSSNNKIDSLFDKIYFTWILRDKNNRLKCLSLFYKILSEMSVALSEMRYVATKQREKIKPAIDYIGKHCFDPDFDYSILATLCGISYSYFKRIFIAVYKMSPSEYIKYLRMEQAKEMLQTGIYKVSAVADALGYADAAYFSRVFKGYTGCSPAIFKEKMSSAK